MPPALWLCYETSPLRTPNRASFWTYNGDPCEKGEYQQRATDLLDTVHAHCVDRPSVKIDRQGSKRKTTPWIIPNSLAKRGVVDESRYTFMNSAEKTYMIQICMTLLGPKLKTVYPPSDSN